MLQTSICRNDYVYKCLEIDNTGKSLYLDRIILSLAVFGRVNWRIDTLLPYYYSYQKNGCNLNGVLYFAQYELGNRLCLSKFVYTLFSAIGHTNFRVGHGDFGATRSGNNSCRNK